MNERTIDCFEILVIIAQRVTGYSLTSEKKECLLNLACLGFLYITLLINVLSADYLLLKSYEPLNLKEAILGGLS